MEEANYSRNISKIMIGRMSRAMKFEKALNDIVQRVKKANIERRTRSRWNSYARSTSLKLAKLYGYRLDARGVAEVIPEESAQVVLALNALADGMSPSVVKSELLDKRGLRNRSGKKWSVSEIERFPRMLYAGLVSTRFGWRKSKVYPELVKASTVKAALKTVQKVSEAHETALFSTQ